jgi:fucose 4-O-acetylase-like acetyltransferase
VEKIRIPFIDIGKGLGIIVLITITHNYFLPDYILNIDGYILMPFFFFLSGYVFNGNQEKNIFIKKKIESLILPYIFFSFVGFLFYLIINKFEINVLNEIEIYFISILSGTPKLLGKYYCNPLWYLYSLFWMNMLFLILQKIKSISKYIILALLVFVSVHLQAYKYELGDSYFANFDVIFISSVFFEIGLIVKKIKLEQYKFYPIITIILGSIIVIFTSIFNSRTILAYAKIDNILLFLLISIVGIFFYISLSFSIKKSTILEFFGKNSLNILGLHYLLLHGVYYRITDKFFHCPIQNCTMLTMVCFIIGGAVFQLLIVFTLNNLIRKIFTQLSNLLFK